MTGHPASAATRLFPLLAVLAEHEVEFVVIGGVAVNAHGVIRATKDVDVVPRSTPENLARLWDALATVDAKPGELEGFRPEEMPVPWTLRSLIEGEGNWILHTRLGRIDVMQSVAGADGYEDLVRNALSATPPEVGRPILFAGLDDLIAMKQEAGRDQDMMDVTALRLANGLEA